jgi:hypothetical protein
MRVSLPVPSEAEIAAEELAMRKGLKGEQQMDLAAYHARERADRAKRQSDRQAEYDKRQL